MTRSLIAVQKPQPFPAKDMQFRNEPFFWAIDFADYRVRRETEITRPLFKPGINDIHFRAVRRIDLIVGNEYRYFEPSIEIRTMEREVEPSQWNVQISKKIVPYVEFEWLPIAWAVGCVEAQSLRTPETRLIDPLDVWQFGGRTTKNNRACFLITVPEGKRDGGAFREYYVAEREPYEILYCAMRTPRGVPWQLDVEYDVSGDQASPKEAKLTQFDYPNSNVSVELLIRFAHFTINGEIASGLFDKTLDPGNKVRFVGKRDKFLVNSDREIVDANRTLGTSGLPFALRVSLIIVSIAFFLIFAIWLWRKGKNRLS